MIAEIYHGVRADVKARGLPFEFTYGPPAVPAKVGQTRLFLCVDDEAGDVLLPARTQWKNPKHVAVRALGLKAVIFASSAREGARRFDHEDLALRIANVVHVAVVRLCERERTLFRVVRAGFTIDPTTDSWAGRVYEMRFQVDTPVAELSYTGEAAPEASPAIDTAYAFDGVGPTTDLPDVNTRIRSQ